MTYILAFLIPIPLPKYGLGEFSIGRTAGNGIDGAGEAERRMEGEDPKEERRLWEMIGGFIGSAKEVGVPGMEGEGDAGASDADSGPVDRAVSSLGAGLPEDILRPGKSIFVTLLCGLSVNWPSFVLRL